MHHISFALLHGYDLACHLAKILEHDLVEIRPFHKIIIVALQYDVFTTLERRQPEGAGTNHILSVPRVLFDILPIAVYMLWNDSRQRSGQGKHESRMRLFQAQDHSMRRRRFHIFQGSEHRFKGVIVAVCLE